jgi:hypothetical protein
VFTTQVIFGSTTFQAAVNYGKVSSNPWSTQFDPESHISDERIPEGVYLICSKIGSVSVLDRLVPKLEIQVTEKMTYLRLEEKEGFSFLYPSVTPTELQVKWRSNWQFIKCFSQGHLEIVIESLLAGELEQISSDIIGILV